MLKIESSVQERTAVIEISGTVDFYEGYQLRDEVKQLLRGGSRYLIFDCREVDYVDSTGVGIFVQAGELARDEGGAVALVAPSPAFEKVLTTTQVDRLLPVFPNVKEATLSLQA